MKTTLITLISLLLGTLSLAQTTDFWVFYTDKEMNIDLTEIFDIKAIERRDTEGISFNISDYPVNSEYEEKVSEVATEFLGSTKWFNASYIKATEDEIAQILNYDFVKTVEKAVIWEQKPLCGIENTNSLTKKEVLLTQQLSMFKPEILDKHELSGKGVRIAVLDAGFPSVDNHIAFEHLRENKKIIDTYDFVKDERFAFRGNAHGTAVLSCIAGKYNDERMGLAQDAEFLLARTEKNFEPFKEEIFWLKAMEWADEKGADLINSSLGYTYHRYFQSDMDGNTSLISKAANKAAEKGILVINAAGNEGSDGWHVIGSPADADSILSIGGVEPDTKLHISFSSYGPTADGRLKPNLAASGKALVAQKGGDYETAFGTSFASPLLCGFAACVKQAFPELTVMELKEKIEKCGNLYPYFDYAHGYGIPNAEKLLEPKEKETHIQLETQDDLIAIKLTDEYYNSMGQYDKDILFYHILNKEHKIEEYKVIEVFQKEIWTLSKEDLEGKTLQIHFKGFTLTKQF